MTVYQRDPDLAVSLSLACNLGPYSSITAHHLLYNFEDEHFTFSGFSFGEDFSLSQPLAMDNLSLPAPADVQTGQFVLSNSQIG